MNLVLMASGEFAIPTFRALSSEKTHKIVQVITQPDRPKGRGRAQRPTPVREFAEKHGVPVDAVPDVNAPEVLKRLKGKNADLALVIAFGQKLGDEVLNAFPLGCFNLHASLLPKYRGAAPIVWAIAHGEERTGVTVFKITNRMDAGPICATRWTFIKPEETAAELHDRLAAIGVDAVKAALALWNEGAIPQCTPQNEAEATRAPKLTKQMGHLDFGKPADEIARWIRAMWDWPGATTEIHHPGSSTSISATLARARVAETTAPNAETTGVLGDGLYVATGNGWLEILEIKPSGGRLMSWADFVNGHHVRAGCRFGP